MIGPSKNNQVLPSYIYFGNHEADYSAESRLELPAGGANACLVAVCHLTMQGDLLTTCVVLVGAWCAEAQLCVEV